MKIKMHNYQDYSEVTENGLNLIHVFNLKNLPNEIREKLLSEVEGFASFNQLILIGHGGKVLWKKINREYWEDDDPIDQYSIDQITSFLENIEHVKNYNFIYPGKPITPLQTLGSLAGWHHPSKFRIGINDKWGSWFAYRAVVLTNSDFPETKFIKSISPCNLCVKKPCITACPANAVLDNDFKFELCFEYRKSKKSKCNDKCLARIACPVGKEHIYSKEQIAYHYGRSLMSLKKMT